MLLAREWKGLDTKKEKKIDIPKMSRQIYDPVLQISLKF
jgi:hypothetical protein